MGGGAPGSSQACTTATIEQNTATTCVCMYVGVGTNAAGAAERYRWNNNMIIAETVPDDPVALADAFR